MTDRDQATSRNARDGSGSAARLVDAVRSYRMGDGEVRALDGVTLDFGRGRFTIVVGPSGSGKSTLLHCLAGLDLLTSGDAYVGEIELGGLNRRKRAIVPRDCIGIVFQGFNLHPSLDIARNIALPSLIAGHKPDPDWVADLVSRLALGNLLHRRPAELSGGEQQRVAVARALVGRPKLILADEPTGNLDSTTRLELLDILRLAVDELEQTVILMTHDLAAACTGDQVVVLSDGKVVEVVESPTVDMMDRLAHLPTN